MDQLLRPDGRSSRIHRSPRPPHAPQHFLRRVPRRGTPIRALQARGAQDPISAPPLPRSLALRASPSLSGSAGPPPPQPGHPSTDTLAGTGAPGGPRRRTPAPPAPRPRPGRGLRTGQQGGWHAWAEVGPPPLHHSSAPPRHRPRRRGRGRGALPRGSRQRSRRAASPRTWRGPATSSSRETRRQRPPFRPAWRLGFREIGAAPPLPAPCPGSGSGAPGGRRRGVPPGDAELRGGGVGRLLPGARVLPRRRAGRRVGRAR